MIDADGVYVIARVPVCVRTPRTGHGAVEQRRVHDNQFACALACHPTYPYKQKLVDLSFSFLVASVNLSFTCTLARAPHPAARYACVIQSRTHAAACARGTYIVHLALRLVRLVLQVIQHLVLSHKLLHNQAPIPLINSRTHSGMPGTGTQS
ncbi:MAG: hypothetical protein EOO65_06150 [Methanosarcinales archaeon]|nr:MAG: hypothetical protein EOO65_06150 [Methanosarcinales archaeon]